MMDQSYPVRLDGDKVIFAATGPRPVSVIYPGLINVEYQADGVVVHSPMSPGMPQRLDKHEYKHGRRMWTAFFAEGRAITVSPDNCSYQVNSGTWIQCAAPIRQLLGFEDGEAVVVTPDDVVGPRNLYRFDRDGGLMWRISSREFMPNGPISSIWPSQNGELVAGALLDGGFTLTLDTHSGNVLQIETNVK